MKLCDYVSYISMDVAVGQLRVYKHWVVLIVVSSPLLLNIISYTERDNLWSIGSE